MLIYAGIDEAGYGPMLGPLCVGMSVFLLENHQEGDPPPNLWEQLDEGVCSSPRDKRRRIAVADSKRLKGARSSKSHPLRHLERGVLAFACASDPSLELETMDDDSFFGRLGAQLPTSVGTPWYESNTSLPVSYDADMISIAAARLRTALDHAGVRLLDLGCISIDAGELNSRLAGGANKASINQDAVLKMISRAQRVASEVGTCVPRIVVDRQGGRMYYREWLTSCIPDSKIRILGENDHISRYEVQDDYGAFVVSFETGSETRHLPVALSSMTAKYIRELAMIRLNRFFMEHVPELQPTAGYVQDGRRFINDVKPIFQTLELKPNLLIRTA